MKTDDKGYDLHVFVCTNDKSDACGDRGGQEIVNKLKAWSKKEGLKGKIRINKAGCLGRCESAVACVAYPKGEWAVKASPNDIEALEEWVKSML